MPTQPPIYRPPGSQTKAERDRQYNRSRAKDAAYIARKKLYDSKEWAAVREYKLTQDPLCEQCKLEQRLTPAKHVDHVKALAVGGDPLNLENLRSLCHPCHSRKTRAEQTGDGTVRIRGCDANGMPLDPAAHWWSK